MSPRRTSPRWCRRLGWIDAGEILAARCATCAPPRGFSPASIDPETLDFTPSPRRAPDAEGERVIRWPRNASGRQPLRPARGCSCFGEGPTALAPYATRFWMSRALWGAADTRWRACRGRAPHPAPSHTAAAPPPLARASLGVGVYRRPATKPDGIARRLGPRCCRGLVSLLEGHAPHLCGATNRR